ncbi:MAG: hypothetical protein H6737_31685 [Alphaproteobacteria bacterium]|nr:hypothetical protein [Alphaproteobacteria bacterium]
MTRNDPAHADEAMFLLQHEEPLRQVLTRELSEDSGWVEGVEPGQEYDTASSWSRDGGPQTHLAEDDETELDEASASAVYETGIMRIEDITVDSIPTHPPAPDRESAPDAIPDDGPSGDEVEYAASEPDGEMTLDATAPEPIGDPVEIQPGVKVNPGVKEVGVKSPTAGGHVGLLQPRRQVRTASPPGRRVATPTLSATLPPPSMSLPPPTDDTPVGIDGAEGALSPSPELARAIAQAATTGRTGEPSPTVALAPPANDDDNTTSALVWLAVGMGVVIVIGFVGGWIWSNSGGTAEVADLDPVTMPRVEPPTPAKIVPVTPDPEPLSGVEGSPPSPALVDPSQPSPTPMPAPVTQPSPAPVTQPSPAPVTQPVVAPVELPAPAPAPAPVTQPSPAPVPDPAPVQPPDPAPVQAPVPQPDPAPVAPAPTQPDPAPVASPSPSPTSERVEPDRPEAEAPDLRGMWTGMVGGSGFVLRVQAQTGSSFSGRAEVLQSTGSWARYSVTGTLDVASGSLRFSNLTGDVSFTGNVSEGPMRGAMTADGETRDFEISR